MEKKKDDTFIKRTFFSDGNVMNFEKFFELILYIPI